MVDNSLKKQNIITPIVTCVIPTTSSYLNGDSIDKKYKSGLGYIRVRREQYLPRSDRYEMNDLDFEFLQEYWNKSEVHKNLGKE